MYRITHKNLKKYLRYDEKSGLFTRLVQSSNRIKVGDIAGSVNVSDGYVYITVGGKRYSAHRLAWFYVTGYWPKDEIDHINGIRSDNRFENLREATSSINKQNQRIARSNNKVGLLGVCKARGKYLAQIRLYGKNKFLGYFENPQLAHSAYIKAKRVIHEGNIL